MFYINAKRKRRPFVTTKVMKYSITEIFLFLLDKLRKYCHKFTHILQLSQSCEQEDFNSSNKFLHLIGPIIKQR